MGAAVLSGDAAARVLIMPAAPRMLIAIGPDALAATAADLLIGWGAEAIGQHGEAHVALTGGSSARGLYQQLRQPARTDALDWGRVHLWFGDDRLVPLDHPDSNAGLAQRELPTRATLHPIPMEDAIAAGTGPEGAAAAYAAQLASGLPARGGVRAFDVLLLGVGPDGHILSVFPGSAALDAPRSLAMAIAAPEHIGPHLPRVTIDPGYVASATHVLLTVAGAAKAAVLAEIFGGVRDPRRWPAQLALGGNATWLLDPESAALL